MNLFSTPMYIKVYENRFVINVFGANKKELEGSPEQPFTTERLLVGNFSEAEKTLSQGIKQCSDGGWFKRSPSVVIHPLEKIEGGLSEVEHRVLMELGLGAGASKVVVHVGPELSEAEVLNKLSHS